MMSFARVPLEQNPINKIFSFLFSCLMFGYAQIQHIHAATEKHIAKNKTQRRRSTFNRPGNYSTLQQLSRKYSTWVIYGFSGFSLSQAFALTTQSVRILPARSFNLFLKNNHQVFQRRFRHCTPPQQLPPSFRQRFSHRRPCPHYLSLRKELSYHNSP